MKVLIVNPLRYKKPKINKKLYLLFERTQLMDAGLQTKDYASYPLEVVYIGGILKSKGYEVKFIDAHIKKIYPQDIDYSEYDVVITSTAPYSKWRCPQAEYRHTIEVLKTAKKYNFKTIVYGPHCSISPDLFREYADCIIIGEPEGVIIQAIEKEEKILKVDEKALPKNLDSWGIPAFELIEFALYDARYAFAGKIKGRLGTLAGSRGCPYRCSFCLKVMIPNKVRFHTPETVEKMVEILVKKYKCVALSWQDLTFTLNKSWTLEVCKRLERLKIPYGIATRSDCIDQEIAKALAKSGCFFVGLGIESGNDKVLVQGYKKGYTWEVSERAVFLLKEAGIPIVGGFQMLFGPYETKRSIKETFRKCKRLNIDSCFAIATPYPTTELWYIGEREGKIPKNLKSWDEVVEIILKTAGTIGNEFTQQDILNFVEKRFMNILNIILAGIRYLKHFGFRSFIKRVLNFIKNVRLLNSLV